MRFQHHRCRTVRKWLIGCLFLLLAVPAPAQFPAPPAGLDSDFAGREDLPLRRLPRNPLTIASYDRALEALQAGDVTQGLETLQQLLNEDEDFFFADGASPLGSLFRRIEECIRPHQAEYDRLFGPAARQLFTEAVTSQNVSQIEKVVRQFALTTAGAEALAELARLNCDAGRFGTAAFQLETLSQHPAVTAPENVLRQAVQLLLQANEPGQAKELLARHSTVFSDPAIQAELLKRPAGPLLARASDAPAYQWWLPYGDCSPARQVLPAPAFTPAAWQANSVHPVYDFWLMDAPGVAERLGTDTRDLMDATEQRIRSQPGRLAMPASRPLIVGNLAILSGPGSVKAFDLKNGEIVWNGLLIDETFEYLTKWTYSAGNQHDVVREEMRDLFAAVRGWRDLTSSSLSSDGERVYAVTDCQLVGTTSPQRMTQNTQRHPLLPQRSNRLVAYDLATEGKILWPTQTSRSTAAGLLFAEPREIFYLGAPLPVDGHLYVLGEERGQVQLFELDPATGEILWSVGLLNPDRDLVLDDVRRLAGLMPVSADGLLICPTGEGSLVAVDPLKRQVVWTHFYVDAGESLRNQGLMMRMVRPQAQAPSMSREELLNDDRWFDTRIMVAGSCVVFTPPDDDSLVCVSLQTGKSHFDSRIPRGQMAYAATTYQDHLILVGRSEITSLNLADGPQLWKQPVPIPAPAGRGLRMGDQFLQPLITGEIAVVDLPTGRLLTRLALPKGQPPGNLTSAEGVLILSTGTGLTALQPRSWLQEQLARAPQNEQQTAQTLSWKGQWELQQGALSTGLEDLKSAVTRSADTGARQVLIWAVLDGLRTDFASYRQQAEQIQNQLRGDDQRLQFLRVYAQGLQAAGESQAAFDQYLQILKILPQTEQLVEIDNRRAVADSRWVLARISEMLNTTDSTLQQALKSRLENWVQTAAPASLFRLLPAFPPGWVDAQVVARRLAEIPLGHQDWQSREILLRPLLKHTDPQVRGTAAALLLELALQTQDGSEARQLVNRLRECEGTISGPQARPCSQIVTETEANPDYQQLLQSLHVWPHQAVLSDQQTPARSNAYQIPLLGPPSEELKGWTFFADQAGGNIEIYDADGLHHGRISAGYPGSRYASEADLGRFVCMHHHLVLVALLDRIVLLDLLSDPETPQVILNRTLAREDLPLSMGRGPAPGPPRLGIRSIQVESRAGLLIGDASSLTDSLLCLSSENNLIAIHPQTGAELWRRRDVPSGSEIFADQEFIVVKPAHQERLLVYRALDGEFLAERALPEGILNCLERGNGDWGRFLPCRITDQDQAVWQMYDPAEDKIVWSLTTPAETLFSVVDGQSVAFFTPDHQLSVRNGLTGQILFQTSCAFPEQIAQFTLLEYPEHWILLTSTHQADSLRRQTFGVRSHDLVFSEVDGTVRALGRNDGAMLWERQIPSQQIATQSPQRWPLLLFAKGHGRLDALILNRFTGKEVWRSTAADDGTGIGWLTETQPLRVQLKFATDRVTLYFEAPTPSESFEAPPQNEAPTQ